MGLTGFNLARREEEEAAASAAASPSPEPEVCPAPTEQNEDAPKRGRKKAEEAA